MESLKKWWKGRGAEQSRFPLDQVTCDFPLWRFEILPGGKIHHCCPTWLPHSVANITEVSLLDAFRSEKSADIRREIQRGNFKYCEAKLCPYLSRYANTGDIASPIHPRGKVAELNETHSVERAKKLLVMLNYDASCNLRCPSCRNELVMYKEEAAPPELMAIHRAVMRNIRELKEAGYKLSLNITGSGDAFASPLYYRLLRELEYDPKLGLELQTNGVLMEEARFTEPMLRMVKFIAVSIDASSQPVYDLVRRGGNFARVRKNMDWLNEAIEGGRFAAKPYVKVNFIVQKENFREMASFAKWILGYPSVSQLWFNQIADWGHLPKEDFAARAVWRAGHPEHAELRECLKDPILRDPRIDLGNLTSYL